MTNIFLSFLGISVSISFIIVLLLLLSPFLNKRYAAKWKCRIWILLALRLVIPLGGNIGSNIPAQMEERTESEAEKESPDIMTDVRRRVIVEIPAQMATPIEGLSERTAGNVSLLDILSFVWMCGSLVFLSVHLISYFHYKRQLLKLGKPVRDGETLRLLMKLKRELHVRRKVSVMEYSEAASPMLIGLFRPILVLPEGQYNVGGGYSQEEMRSRNKESYQIELFFILKHELIHLKRGDICFKLLFATVGGIHWFNPLVWIMQREAAVDMELSCDERVMQGCDFAAKKAYTETLLSALHKQNAKRTVLTTQFYGGKQIMKKRFKNIFVKTGKKNGAAILIIAAALTISLGTLVGCSVGKTDTEGIPGQAGDSSLPETADPDMMEENGMENENGMEEGNGTGNAPISEETSITDVPGGETAAENTMILTIMKEGEPEEKPATLVVGNSGSDEYSFYLPEGEWQKEEADMWRAVVNENVRLWVARFEEDYDTDIEQVLADDGYRPESGELVKQEGEIIYRARLYESGNDIWCVGYCYPEEAEEGWGRELPVIADTFAVTVSDVIDGYITAFDSGFVTVDRQIWATVDSEYWKPEYNEAAGFEVVDAQEEDITYPLREDCSFSVLENHHDPTVELSADEFADYLEKMEYPVLWVLELKNGEVISIWEQYLP